MASLSDLLARQKDPQAVIASSATKPKNSKNAIDLFSQGRLRSESPDYIIGFGVDEELEEGEIEEQPPRQFVIPPAQMMPVGKAFGEQSLPARGVSSNLAKTGRPEYSPAQVPKDLKRRAQPGYSQEQPARSMAKRRTLANW